MKIQDPNHFYQLFVSNKINLQTLLEYLLTIIDKSEVLEHRIKSIELLNNLELRDKNVNRLIENILVSDENYIIRALGFKYLLSNEPHSASEILKWAILNDSSTLFLRDIKKYFNPNEVTSIRTIFEQRIETYSQNLQLYSIETHFLIDLGIELNSLNLILTNFDVYYIQGEKLLLLIKDQRIHELNLVSRLESIPESIGNLTELEVLNLSYNNLITLPKTIKNLKKLRILDLSWNNFVNIPKSIIELPSLRVLDLGHNYIDEIPERLLSLKEKVNVSLADNPISMK